MVFVYSWNVCDSTPILKGYSTHKMKILALITYPHVVPEL